jgi:hypothetical protein
VGDKVVGLSAEVTVEVLVQRSSCMGTTLMPRWSLICVPKAKVLFVSGQQPIMFLMRQSCPFVVCVTGCDAAFAYRLLHLF